jgi:hypothetical protein
MSDAKKRHSDPMKVQIAIFRLLRPVEVSISIAWASCDKIVLPVRAEGLAQAGSKAQL